MISSRVTYNLTGVDRMPVAVGCGSGGSCWSGSGWGSAHGWLTNNRSKFVNICLFGQHATLEVSKLLLELGKFRKGVGIQMLAFGEPVLNGFRHGC